MEEVVVDRRQRSPARARMSTPARARMDGRLVA
jgi:hypothetical protein